MSHPKFAIDTVGVGPVLSTDQTPRMLPKDVMAAAPRHLRAHAGAGSNPVLEVPTKVLRNNELLRAAAFELAAAHYSAEAGGIASPSRKAIVEQTPALAERIGIATPAQSAAAPLGFGQRRKPSAPAAR